MDFLLLSNNEPYNLGVYLDGKLLKSYEQYGKAANACPQLFSTAFNEFGAPNRVLFASGPGNLTSIKIGYVCAKTVAIAQNAKFLGALSFNFNNFQPIFAFGKKTFEQKDNTIIISDAVAHALVLPHTLDGIDFIDEQKPVYPLPSVH